MKHLISILTALVLVVFLPAAPAVKIFQCEDAQGNRTFEAHCPPGTTAVTSKQYRTPGDRTEEQTAPEDLAPITLYVVSDCDACDAIKDFLAARNITAGEKDVNADIETQNALREKIGDLKVPTLVVGDSVVTGFNRSALKQALAAAGYKLEED